MQQYNVLSAWLFNVPKHVVGSTRSKFRLNRDRHKEDSRDSNETIAHTKRKGWKNSRNRLKLGSRDTLVFSYVKILPPCSLSQLRLKIDKLGVYIRGVSNHISSKKYKIPETMENTHESFMIKCTPETRFSKNMHPPGIPSKKQPYLEDCMGDHLPLHCVISQS